MFMKFVALLMIISLIGCSTAPRSGSSSTDEGAHVVSSIISADPATPPAAESRENRTPQAEDTADHGKELAKAAKTAAGVVLVAAFLVIYAAAALAVALAA